MWCRLIMDRHVSKLRQKYTPKAWLLYSPCSHVFVVIHALYLQYISLRSKSTYTYSNPRASLDMWKTTQHGAKQIPSNKISRNPSDVTWNKSFVSKSMVVWLSILSIRTASRERFQTGCTISSCIAVNVEAFQEVWNVFKSSVFRVYCLPLNDKLFWIPCNNMHLLETRIRVQSKRLLFGVQLDLHATYDYFRRR